MLRIKRVKGHKRRKPRKPAGRARWLLAQVARFVQRRGWWPSARELSEYHGRGSRWTTWRDLKALQHEGLVGLERRAWVLTHDGYGLLGMTPIPTALGHKPRVRSRAISRVLARIMPLRLAAYRVFDADPVPPDSPEVIA